MLSFVFPAATNTMMLDNMVIFLFPAVTRIGERKSVQQIEIVTGEQLIVVISGTFGRKLFVSWQIF
jgi:hypothetical protein